MTHPLALVDSTELKGLTRAADRLLVGSPLLAPGSRCHRRRAGSGLEFRDFRDFAPGDDPRNIDWRASARSSVAQIRRHYDDRAADWVLCLDRSASMTVGARRKWHLALQLAAAFAYLLLDLDHRVGLVVFSDQVDDMRRPGRGRSAYAQLLRRLYAAEPGSLLSIPRTPALSPKDGTAPPTNPALTAEENEAFAQLRTYFRTQHAELPSLPDLALKIGKAIDDPNNANEDIARLIQLDPSLSARLISVVNSAAFGGFNRITSINQASARLGRNKVRSLVYSCLLKSIFKISSTPLKRHMEALWQHSVHVAALAFVLGRETPGIDAEQALLAGLIHDIGSVAVIGGINRFPVLARRQEVIDYAIASLRIEVGVHTLRHWRLGDEFGDVITDAENWQRVGSAIPDNTDVVILSQLHALIGSAGQGRLPRIDEVPAFHKLARGQLTPRHSLSILDEADADVREVRALIGGS